MTGDYSFLTASMPTSIRTLWTALLITTLFASPCLLTAPTRASLQASLFLGRWRMPTENALRRNTRSSRKNAFRNSTLSLGVTHAQRKNRFLASRLLGSTCSILPRFWRNSALKNPSFQTRRWLPRVISTGCLLNDFLSYLLLRELLLVPLKASERQHSKHWPRCKGARPPLLDEDT
jgi:hypothetical protein